MGPVRAELLWQAVQDAVTAVGRAPLAILDLGGGTGSDAVRLAGLGHRVTVIDSSPDALASLERRARDAGVDITGVLADATEDVALDAPVDLVLCHGVLEHLDDPSAALARVGEWLDPAGWVSVVVPGRVAAVTARAIAGDFVTAQALAETSVGDWDVKALGPRRYLVGELEELLGATGLVIDRVAGVRVVSDLVPSSVVDIEPGAREALFALDRALAANEAFTEHSGGMWALARLDWRHTP